MELLDGFEEPALLKKSMVLTPATGPEELRDAPSGPAGPLRA